MHLLTALVGLVLLALGHRLFWLFVGCVGFSLGFTYAGGEDVSFFLGREKLSIAKHSKMSRWRSGLLLFLSRNAMDAASFFDIPPDQVIEVGVRLDI